MKKQFIIALLWASAQLCHAQIPPFEGSDNFAGASKNPAKWGGNIFNGTGLLTQTGGVLKFSNAVPSAGEEDHFMAWPWQAYGPMETSWSVQADVNVPVIPLPDDNAAIGIGVVVRNGSDGNDIFAMQVENVRSTGQPPQYNFFNSLDINEDNHSEFSTPAPKGKVLTVRIVWNADTLTLTAQYDADGPLNGYSWQTLNTFNPAFNGWDMTPFDNFEVAVFGYAEKVAVAASKNVYLDNFLIAPVSPVNLAGSDNFNDDTKDLGKWGADEGENGSTLTEINGRLEFTKADTADSWAGRPWVANTGSFTEDWEAFADVHVGDLDLPVPGDDLRIYLDVAAAGFNASVMLELKNDAGTVTKQFRFEEEGPGAGEASAPTTATDGVVRVAFDSTDKILNFYYEDDGSDGYAWTLLGSVDVDDPFSDWGLMDLSRFRISVQGESEGVVVASGEAYADNFNSASAYEPPIFGTPNNFDLFTTPDRNTQKWGQIVENGNAELTQSGDGVVRFAADMSAPDDDSMEAWIWQSNGSYSSSWSAQVDVNVPVIPLAPGNTAAGMGIAVLNSADPEDNFTAALENYRTTGQPQEFHFLSTIDINRDGIQETLPEEFAPASSTLGSVRVAWNHTTKQLTAAYDADGPLNGYSWTVFKTFSPVGAANWNMTASNSFRIAIYGSAEETAITEGHGFWADNFYVFGSTTTLLPVVKTQAATDVYHESATVHGEVNAKGSQRAVYVDWGLTTAYGSTQPADPGIADGTSNTIILGELTGLMPHTKYHYRVRATNALGTASGANMTFTTKNRDPVADVDDFTVLPGAVVTLDVLDGDTDPDGDALSIQSFSAVSPTSAGKLVKSGNNLVFTAAATFNSTTFPEGAFFTYIAKDAFGGATTSTRVDLTPGTCTLSETELAMPSGGTILPATGLHDPYRIDVTADGAWSVAETLPWASCVPDPFTNGDGFVGIIVQPNTALAQRVGTVKIGGQVLTITQAGVLAPEISLGEDPPPPAIVSGQYHLDIVTTNAPVTYTVTNMPPGLTINQANGHISGIPTKAGTYLVTVKAKNAAITTAVALTFTIEVAPLDVAYTGVFHGFIAPDIDANGMLGSRVEFTVTSKGGVTGKLITGIAMKPIVGQLQIDANDPSFATLTVSMSKPPAAPTFFSVTLDPTTGGFNGVLGDPILLTGPPAIGWRNPWKTTNKATAFAALHTFSLQPPPPDPNFPFPSPEGFGFGSFKPNETTGAVTVTGKLPDNTTFMTTTFIGGGGEVLIYAPLYGNTASVSGILTVLPYDDSDFADNEVSGTLAWFKFPVPPTSKVTV
ncbi:MAG: putative Ig domain-containing protein, partial [Prosthecobacter sp.]|nr:putative Ig domain-containing protein [Prosthecobacter sp.]